MRSLRGQLTVRLLLGGALLLAGAGAVLRWEVRRALAVEFDNSLRATAQSFSAQTEQDAGSIKMEFAAEMMPQFERTNGAEVFLLRTADGDEIRRSKFP